MFSYFKMNLFLSLHLLEISEHLFRVCFGSDRMIVSFSATQRLQFFAQPRRDSVRMKTSQSIVKSKLFRLHFHKCFESSEAQAFFHSGMYVCGFNISL